MSHVNSGSKPELTEKVNHQQSLVGLVWFCQLKTNPVTQSVFNYLHGTGPRPGPLLPFTVVLSSFYTFVAPL